MQSGDLSVNSRCAFPQNSKRVGQRGGNAELRTHLLYKSTLPLQAEAEVKKAAFMPDDSITQPLSDKIYLRAEKWFIVSRS